MQAADRARREGDGSDRFDALFDAHYAEVLAFALRRTASRSEAEEIAAEAFAVAWRRGDSVPTPAIPWLYGVANRLLRNQQRSGRRQLRLMTKLSAERAPLGRDPAESVSERDAATIAFSRLSTSQREVLQIVAWEGLDADEAADVLGCSTGAFRVRLHRARRELAKQLDRIGHEGTQASSISRSPSHESQ
jgi:RNA polymerase sigma-70 factor (ECF subfamily)